MDIDSKAPADTEWAYGSTKDVSADDYEPWVNGIKGSPTEMVGKVISLHLITDDLYFDVEFHKFSSGGNAGGGFSYTRTAVR